MRIVSAHISAEQLVSTQQVAIKTLSDELKADVCAIGLFSENRSSLTFEVSIGTKSRMVTPLDGLPPALSQLMTERREITEIGDLQGTEFWTSITEKQLAKVFVIPLHGSSQGSLGFILLGFSKQRSLTPHELSLLRTTGNSLGSAIESCGLAHALETRTSQLQLLLRFQRSVSSLEDVTSCLQLLAANLVAGFETSFAHVMLARPDGKMEVCAAYAVQRQKGFRWEPGLNKQCRVLSDQRSLMLLRSGNGPGLRFDRRSEQGPTVLTHIKEELHLLDLPQSVLVIPLFDAGRALLGLCVIGEMRSPMRRLFTDDEVNLIAAAASQVIPVLLRNQEIERQRRRARLLERMQSAIGSMLGLLDEEAVLNSIATSVIEVLNAELCSIFLLRGTRWLKLVATAGGVPPTQPVILDAHERGLTAFIYRADCVINLRGPELHLHPSRVSTGPHPHLQSGTCVSLLGIPLRGRGEYGIRSIGLIKVENKKRLDGSIDTDGGFDDEDKVVLSTMAAYAQTAIQNANAYRLAQALQEAAIAVGSSLELRQVLDSVLSELSRVVSFQTASVQLLNRASDMVEIAACSGYVGQKREQVLRLRFPMTQDFPNYEVISKKQPKLWGDLRQTRFRHFWEQTDIYHTEHIRCWLGVPLIYGSECIGMLAVDAVDPYSLSDVDIQNTNLFARHAAIAIGNARHFDTREHQVQELRAVKDLATSATILAGIGLEAIAGAPRRNTPITDTSLLVRPVDPQCLSLDDLLSAQLDSEWASSLLTDVRIQKRLQLAGPVTLRAQWPWLARAFAAVLDNAGKAARRSAEPVVTISSERVCDTCEITISDTGPGIPPDVQTRLFKVPIEPADGGLQAGLGLLTARTIAQTYGGDVCLISTGATGTVVAFRFPMESEP